MKRREFFKTALALVGLKALGVDKKLLPNPEWVDAQPHTLTYWFNESEGQWVLAEIFRGRIRQWKDSKGKWSAWK